VLNNYSRACVFLNSLKCNRLNFFQRAGLPERRAEKHSILHAQSMSRLDSYNFGAGLDYNFFCSHKASEARPIIWATAEFFVWTEDHLNSRNYRVRLVSTKNLD
jgi:hypothetical protein